jgi:drug/metabolite transporter (DMT)-like permease
LQVGIALAVAAALLGNLASLLKHRGCQCAEPIRIQRPLRSARRLAASPWFTAGWGLAAIAWFVHIAALSMAPISLVQAVLAGGAVTLAVMAQRIFGDPVEWRQWLALLLGGSGLAMLVLTVPNFSGTHSGFDLGAILGFEGGLVLVAAALVLGHRSERLAGHGHVLIAAIGGILFALAGVAIKGLTGADGVSIAILIPWVLAIVLVGVLAQYTAAAALQLGGAIETIGLMGLIANAAQIVGGVLVFGDPLSSHPLGLVLQGSAFAMVCASALLIPSRRAGLKPLAVKNPLAT